MTRFLTVNEVCQLHDRAIAQFGGSLGIRDRNALDSAIAQPQMTFGGEYLYRTEIEQATALAFSLIMNHPFIDGNKRVAYSAMRVFLILNGWEIETSVDDKEQTFLALAAGKLKREDFNKWLEEKVKKFESFE
ncbi:MAG: type II toxin-antitoxin system death-on-curing family toxin [Cyanobacteria bacterium P01_E01_bin.42]